MKLSTVLSIVCVCSTAVQAEDDRAPWWDAEWKFRKVVRIDVPSFLTNRPEDQLEVPRGLGAMDIGTFIEQQGAPQDSPDHAEYIGDLRTASVVVHTEGEAAPNFRDIRVRDGGGNTVPFQVRSAGELVEVAFRVLPKTADYYIYYGNPEARPERHSWRPRNAYIRRFTARSNVGVASTTENAVRAFRTGNAHSRELSLSQINQLKWRGALGPGYHVSVYEAFLDTEEAGEYEFAISAISPVFVAIDHRTVLESDFSNGSARSWVSRVKAQLSAGAHYLRIIHIHRRSPGGRNGQQRDTSTLRLGWMQPGGSGFQAIPPSAFLRALDAREIAFETPDGPRPVFFTVDMPSSQVELDEVSSTGLVHFSDLSNVETNSQELRYEWNVGEMPVSTGSFSRNLIVSRKYPVSLEIFQGHQSLGKYSRTVFVSRRRHSEPLDVKIDFTSLPIFLYNLERTSFAVRIANRMTATVVVQTSTSVSNGKEQLSKDTNYVTVGPSKDATIFVPLDGRRFGAEDGLIHVSAMVNEQQIFDETMLVKRWKNGLKGLRSDRGLLLNTESRRTILLNDVEDANKYRKWAPVKWLTRITDKSPKRVLVIGDPMRNSPSDESYVNLLQEQIEKEEEAFSFQPWSLGLAPCLGTLLNVPAQIEKHSPEIVIIAPGLRDLMTSTQVRPWSRAIDIMIDLARDQKQPAQVILISPTPLLSKPKLSELYSLALKKLAAEHHCVFINLHDRLKDSSNWQEENYAADADKSLLLLYPNSDGQKKISALIKEVVY